MFIENLINEYVKNGFIDKTQATEIAQKCALTDASPSSIIVENNYCSNLEALKVLSKYYGIPFSHIDSFEIQLDLLEKVSKFTLIENKFLPVSLKGDIMTVAISDPTNLIALGAIKTFHIGRVNYVLVDEEQLLTKIQSLAATQSASDVIKGLNENSTVKESNKAETEEIQNAPAVKLVDSFIREAISYKASDIHIEPYDKTVRVRYRIDGTLYERTEFHIESYPAVCARLKILAGINIAERRIPQDGRINQISNGVEYDLRVSTLPTVYGEKFVIRILDKSSFDFSRSDLGFTKSENAIVDKILAHPYGIILLTGPTGCGKSTTLYSFLKELNKVDVNIVTVEDPVEYTLQGVNQTQVNIKANMTFASALRSILRQDPNIVMIGEIRDEETAKIAIRAAITGHLVFSTLHTNDAPGSINRLIDMGIEPYLVADATVGIIAQRLVKKLCPQCKEKVLTTPAETALLKLDKPTEIYKPHGCPFCHNTGYKGRTAVHEIMYLNDKIREAINNRVFLEDLRELAIQHGMVPLWDACKELVLNGITSINELSTLMSD